MDKKFSFTDISDITTARELQEAGFMGGCKQAIYNFFNLPDVPVVKIGRRKFITKKALIDYFDQKKLA